MQLFIAWSGDRSKLVSDGLETFLREVSPDFKAWVSHKGIVSGADWRKDLASALKTADMGIICLTRSTIGNPWLAYEAGALSVRQRRRICPYLLDTDMGMATSPLSHFQMRRAVRSDTWELVKDINRKTSSPMGEGQLLIKFDDCWPNLDRTLRETPREKIPKRFNRLNRYGLECLLAVHFRASVDRLVHAIEDGITDPTRIDMEHITARATTAVIEGRRLLDPFFTDQFGYVSKFLQHRLPLERLAELLRNTQPVFEAAQNAKGRHKVVYDFIRREQEILMAYIAETTPGGSESDGANNEA